MNVKELKESLEGLPDDMKVILQVDSEGSNYKSLLYSDSNIIALKEGYGYDVYNLDWTADDACMDEEDWGEMKKKGDKVLVLS